MELINLSVDRIIIHQVFQRNSDGNKIQPILSNEYTKFNAQAMSAFKSRVIDALGDGSKAVEMHIVNQGKNDLPTLIDKMIDQDDHTFPASTFDIANKLTDVQQRKSIPGGIVVVFTGKQGVPSKKYLGIIKAEVHSGYEKEVNNHTNEISLKFVEELLLTPGTRLYKTAAFFEKSSYEKPTDDLNDRWAVMVSDYQISQADGKAAAQYFFSDFLGFGYPETSARTTKLFYEKASSFIKSMQLPSEQKSDFYNALITYLKVGASSTISSTDFAAAYFQPDIQDSFTNYMRDAGLPTSSFTKDTSHIERNLKYRKVNFSKNIKLVAPLDAFKNLVTIETIAGDPDKYGTPAEWTKITIKDKISSQE